MNAYPSATRRASGNKGDHGTRAGTYLEHEISGPNVYKLFVSTRELAESFLAEVDAVYLKYGNVHTLKTRTVVVGEWE